MHPPPGEALPIAFMNLPALPVLCFAAGFRIKYLKGVVLRLLSSIWLWSLLPSLSTGKTRQDTRLWMTFHYLPRDFLVYGSVMMIGVQALDLVPKKATGTAAGFTGLFGYQRGPCLPIFFSDSLLNISVVMLPSASNSCLYSFNFNNCLDLECGKKNS